MKKINFVNSVQSGVGVLLLLLLCLLPCARVKAQTVLSAQYVLPSCRGLNVIVRESSAGLPVIAYRHVYINTGVGILYGDMATNNAKMFVIPDTTFVDGALGYTIKDMRVVGDMCYFCGMRVRDHFDGSSFVTDSVGVLGRFRLPPLGFDKLVKYDLKLIDETKSLDRMAAFAGNSDTVLAMIGIVNNPASESCLTVARVNYAGQWDYYVEYTDNSVVEEVFTDIAVDHDNVTIASYHRNTEGRNHFNLRISSNYDVRHDTYSYFDILNEYTPTSISMESSCYTLARPDYAAVRLCAEPNESKVHAAFACYTDNTLPVYPTAMCEIETVSKVLLSAQIVQKTYLTAHTLVDMAYIETSLVSGGPAAVALLHQTDGMYKTVVEYPYANIGSYGSYPQALMQQKTDEMLGSVCAHDRDDVRFGGVLNSATTRLTYLQEMLPPITSTDKCMHNSEVAIKKNVTNEVPMKIPCPLLSRTDGMQKLNWAHKTEVRKDVDANNPCIY